MHSWRTPFGPVLLLLLFAGPGQGRAQPPCNPGTLFDPAVFYSTGSYAIESAVADFNEDGKADLAVANYTANTVSILLGAGDGSFTQGGDVFVSSPTNLVTADFDEDGDADLAVTRISNSVVVLLGNGAGSFPSGAAYPVADVPRGLTVDDFNEDGIQDLAVAANAAVSILLGDGSGGVGNGSFLATVSYAAHSAWGIAAGDLDGDGITDLAVANGSHAFLSYLLGLGSSGVGDGRFSSTQSITVGSSTREIVAADFTGDGRTDLAAAGGMLSVLIGLGADGNGLPTFRQDSYPTAALNGVAALQATPDDELDLAVTESPGSRVLVYRGRRSDGSFLNPEAYAVGPGPIGITVANLDTDAQADLVVSCSGNGNTAVLLGNCGSPLPPGSPVITGFAPTAGEVGTEVSVLGSQLADVTDVRFNGVTAPILSASFGEVRTQVPTGASTGRITVTNPQGTATSSSDFVVGHLPVITAAEPDSGKEDASITIRGQYFTAAQRVSFGPVSNGAFTVDSDEQITAVVDPQAQTGPIYVTNPIGTRASSFLFRVIPLRPTPAIVAVRDVPNDQGGRVVITWERSDLDRARFRQITGYRVWRRAPVGGGNVRADFFATSMTEVGSTEPVYWEPLVTLPAALLPGYAYVAPTTQDSLEGGHPYTAFFVQALTSDPFVFHTSTIDSGYSVDNLSPVQPSPFVAEYRQDGVALHWKPNRDGDLFGYRLYRGPSPSFVPSADNRIAAQPDTGFFDASGTSSDCYKLSAVDVHGNESRFALVTPNGPTSTLATLLSVDPQPDRVRIRWDASANPGLIANLQRRTPDTDWADLASVHADGRGLIEFEDREVSVGSRYGYRLRIAEAGTDIFAGEVWVDVPLHSLALRGVSPNPFPGGELNVSFALPDSRPAVLELLDVTGRCLWSRDLAGPVGWSQARISGATLKPGVYLIRLKQARRSVTAKAVVVR